LATFEHNDVWSATGTYSAAIWPVPDQTAIKGNISANPNFVNAAQGNYELNYNSPCIDAADGTVAPLTDLDGAPRYNDPLVTVKGGIPNANGVYPDMGAYEYVQTASSSVDLVANSVIGPATETAGQTITVQWNDVNIGTGSATGPWHDTISLVPMNGAAPLVVATVLVAQNEVLGPGQTYAASANVVVPGGNPGSYRWQVKVNSQGDVFEGVNWTNNTALAAGTSFLEDPPVAIGGAPATNTFTAPGQSNIFAIASPGTPFVLTAQANAPGCALKLFVGDGYVPSTSSFDFQSSQFDSPTASVTIPSNNHDTYYVLVYAASLNGTAATYTLTVTEAGFALTSVSPSTIVNSGPVTIQVSGDELADNDIFTLVGPGGSFGATSIQSSDPTLAYAIFNLGGAASGSYNLTVAQPSGPTLVLSSAVLVTTAPTNSSTNASSAAFSVQLELPSGFRAGRTFSGSVVYKDSGATDILSPILILSSGGDASLAVQGSTNFSTSDLLLVAASFQGPAGTLTPGSSWTIGFSAYAPSDGSIPFEVDYKTADATDLIDYTTLGEALRPAGYSDSDWNVIWTHFQTQAGPTWGGFVSLVDSYSTEMALNHYAGTFYLVPDVLAFAFADILATANPNVVGTVYLNNTNQPAPGAEILFSSDSTNGPTGGGTSQSDGTFAIGGLVPGTYSVSISGYLLPSPVSITIPPSGYVSGVSIIVNQGGTISGTLSNGAYATSPSPASPAYAAQQFGPVLSNITVEAFGTSNQFSTTSDQNGDYSLSGLPPDTYEVVELGQSVSGVTSSFPTGVQFAVQYVNNLVVGADASLVQNFNVPINSEVAEAQVFAAGSTSPITDATVQIELAPNVFDTTNTQSSGIFAFPVDESALPITITAPGYLPFAGTVNSSAGPTSPQVFYLTQPSAFEITLDTSTGAVITNGVITITSNGVVVGTGVTGLNGEVTISNLAAGTYSVQETAYGYLTINTTLTVGTGGATTSSSTLTSLGGIIGQVSNGTGSPISGIPINIYGNQSTNDTISLTAETDANGNYSALGLPPGSYGVSVGNEQGVNPQTTQILSNELRTVNFSLSGSLLQGTVLASDGVTPVPFSTVTLSQAGQILGLATTDTNGAYLLRVLIPGTYNLAASATSGLSASQSIVVGASGNVTVPALVFGSDTMTILVTDTSNDPLTNATITLFPTTGGPTVPQVFSAATGSLGVATISGLIDGPYTVFVHASGYARAWQTFTLSGSSNQTYVLNPGVTLSGTIQNTSGQPVSQGMVSVYDPVAANLVAVATADLSGNYSVPDLYLGTFNVLFSQASYQSVEIPNVVVNSSPFTQNAVLPSQTTSLSGTVTDASAVPLASSLVVITNNNGVTFGLIQVTNNGTWSINQLPPGNYFVTIISPGYLPPSPAAVNLVAGTPVVLNNALPAVATDDNDTDDDSILGTLVTGLGNFIQDALGTTVRPYHISIEAPPAAGPCPEAQQALADCLHAKAIADLAEDAWIQGYRGSSEALGATGATAIVHSLATALDAVAAHPSASAFEGYVGLGSMPAATQAAVKGADYSTVIAHLVTSFNDIKNGIATLDPTDPTSLTTFLSGSVSDLIANGLDNNTIKDLKAGLVGNPGNPLSVVGDVITLLNDFYTGYGDYQSAVGINGANMLTYQTAANTYSRLVGHLIAVNQDCPPINPPPIPPDNPTPGPKQPINSIQSGDPNDKFASGIGQPGWVPTGTAISYTIEFANETNASAPAQEVTISDPLSASLDWSTLQLTGVGFNNVVITIPPGVQTFSTNVNVSTDPNPVAVSASLNPATGVLSWLIESINPATGQLVTDPLAGFLPPDNAAHQGEGYVTYTVQPLGNMPTGAPITNQASIVFDVNAAILTPTTTNFVGSGTPVITVQPQDVTTNLGGTAVFGVTLADAGPYLYQWSKDGNPLVGATNSLLVLNNVQVSDAASYTVSVSTGLASTNSEPAVLTVSTNPSAGEIEIVISGSGKVNPPDNGKALVIGHTYTITAEPAKGYIFANWSGFIYTNTAALKFVMQSNMLLEANFVPNIFLSAEGAYAGLFAPVGEDREQTNSGSFALSVTTAGTFSGQLKLGGETVALKGKFGVTGAAEVVSARRGESTLTTTLQLDLANQAVEGTVSDGSFTSTLLGNQSVFTTKNPATVFEGDYTLIVPGNSNPEVGPFGISYGTLKVSSSGAVTFAGSLADGTPITQSSVISKNGYWPLYVSLYGGKGSLWGWNYFADHTIVSAPTLSWLNATNGSKTAVYRSGFTNQQATLAGYLYVPNLKPSLELEDAQVLLETFNPPVTIMNQITLMPNNTIVVPANAENNNALKLKITSATGLISGTFANPDNAKQAIKINGVLLQGATNASGYFLGTNQSGALMVGQP
jgi:hypothetical protein